LDFFFRFLSGN
jgi:hypothetical protein